MQHRFLALAMLASADAAVISTYTTVITSSVLPPYFQSTPEVFQGPTPTGSEPFLAQTNPVTFSGATTTTFFPASPLQTQEPIQDQPAGDNIFTQMGNIGPYRSSPGFGVDEYPLPNGSEIVWMNMLARHGSRYPTDPNPLGSLIPGSGATFSGQLSWLNNWTYVLGTNILTPLGRQE